MRIQQLELLLSIAQTGSLRSSAEVLNVTQPALTKALRLLEDEFGTALVLRGPRGVRLAPAGELLAVRAASALRELDRAREEVATFAGRSDAGLALGLSPAAAMLLAPAALSRFCDRWPDVQVRIVDALYPRSLAQLRAGEIDLAIGPLPLDVPGSDIVMRPLFEYGYRVVARRSHPLSGARRLAQLSDAAWVRVGPVGGPGDPARGDFEAHGLRGMRMPIQCESFSTLLSVMPGLDVVGIMPEGFFDRYGPSQGLVSVPIEDRLPRNMICAAWRADTPLTLPAQRMLDAITSASVGQAAQAVRSTPESARGRANVKRSAAKAVRMPNQSR